MRCSTSNKSNDQTTKGIQSCLFRLTDSGQNWRTSCRKQIKPNWDWGNTPKTPNWGIMQSCVLNTKYHNSLVGFWGRKKQKQTQSTSERKSRTSKQEMPGEKSSEKSSDFVSISERSPPFRRFSGTPSHEWSSTQKQGKKKGRNG